MVKEEKGAPNVCRLASSDWTDRRRRRVTCLRLLPSSVENGDPKALDGSNIEKGCEGMNGVYEGDGEKGVKEANRWNLIGFKGKEMCWWLFLAKISGDDETRRLHVSCPHLTAGRQSNLLIQLFLMWVKLQIRAWNSLRWLWSYATSKMVIVLGTSTCLGFICTGGGLGRCVYTSDLEMV
ncbi:hypothetical protein L2E82_23011 [Cichorium intybus]|uniref:Uncharacterized protein n=1 Tax=Cichorium intybus TaxID=13427 RepID=A0ACB9E0B4_CICIN|nr:hypothetical protein L2E82_23011 [Cichorium intybus]